MLLSTSENVEIRGVANKVTAKGKQYVIVNVETDDGTPYGLYCPDPATALPADLRKGDYVTVYFEFTIFNGHERVSVRKVEKA